MGETICAPITVTMDTAYHTEPELEAVVSNNKILPYSVISLDDYLTNCSPTYDTIYLSLVPVGGMCSEIQWMDRRTDVHPRA